MAACDKSPSPLMLFIEQHDHLAVYINNNYDIMTDSGRPGSSCVKRRLTFLQFFWIKHTALFKGPSLELTGGVPQWM